MQFIVEAADMPTDIVVNSLRIPALITFSALKLLELSATVFQRGGSALGRAAARLSASLLAPRYWCRRYLAWRYLRGDGIEIGALHLPLPVSAAARVKYVDRMSVADLRKHYSELAALPLLEPDIVDNGEKLDKIPAASLDFIIANHFLEHCQDPVGTIERHLSRLKVGGFLYYAVPLKNFTFDSARTITPVEHMLADNADGGSATRRTHYHEWVTLVNKVNDPAEVERQVQELMRMDYSIHFHVWDQSSFLALLNAVKSKLGDAFSIEQAVHWPYHQMELVTVLRKVR